MQNVKRYTLNWVSHCNTSEKCAASTVWPYLCPKLSYRLALGGVLLPSLEFFNLWFNLGQFANGGGHIVHLGAIPVQVTYARANGVKSVHHVQFRDRHRRKVVDRIGVLELRQIDPPAPTPTPRRHAVLVPNLLQFAANLQSCVNDSSAINHREKDLWRKYILNNKISYASFGKNFHVLFSRTIIFFNFSHVILTRTIFFFFKFFTYFFR